LDPAKTSSSDAPFPCGQDHRVLTGDWAQQHARAVLAVCLAHVADPNDAEDLMQTVFAIAIEKLHTLRDRTKVRPWLLQIARNKCRDHARRRRPTAPLPTDVPQPPPPDREQVRRLHGALATLPPDHREAITLHYLAHQGCRSIAEAQGTSVAAVRQRLFRARLALRRLLQEKTP
jgi:RNA polymerase sigma-70 factor, ECF subfamily